MPVPPAAPDPAAQVPDLAPTPKTVRFVVSHDGVEADFAASKLSELVEVMSASGFTVDSAAATEVESRIAAGVAAGEAVKPIESWGAFEFVVVVVVKSKKRKSKRFDGTAVVWRTGTDDPILSYQFDRDAFDHENDEMTAFAWLPWVMASEEASAK